MMIGPNLSNKLYIGSGSPKHNYVVMYFFGYLYVPLDLSAWLFVQFQEDQTQCHLLQNQVFPVESQDTIILCQFIDLVVLNLGK